MACAIQATAGHAAANSYATVAEGTTYHESHLYASAWENASADEQCRALVMATRMMDTWFDWHGTPAASGQGLLWPRDGAYGKDGYELASDEIPAGIRDATIEWARQLLAADRTADSETETQGIKALKAGSVMLQFRDGVAAKPIPDAVLVMASHYGVPRSRSGGAVTLQRA
jgi:hypothetical protein